MILHGPSLSIPTGTIHDQLLKKCLENSKLNEIAYQMAENEEDQISYQKMHDFSIVLSEWFVENGFKKGDVILIAAANHWKYFVTTLASWRAGLIVSVASSQFTPYEYRYQIETASPQLIFVDDSTSKNVLKAADGIKIRNFITFSKQQQNSLIEFENLLEKKIQNLVMPTINLSEDVAFLPFSSGTTGKPKGVMLTHLNLSATLYSFMTAINEMIKAKGLPDGFAFSHELHFLPSYHSMGMFRSLFVLYRGSTQILFANFDMELMLKYIEKYSIMVLSLVPAILIRLVNSSLLNKYDISSLTSVSVGSAPLPDGAVQKLKKLLPTIEIAQGYGMTEMTLASHIKSVESDEKSVGRLLPGLSMIVKPVDTDNDNVDDQRMCGPGEVGECWIKGPQIMKGYWKMENVNKTIFDRNGFMRTGDIVYFNQYGDTYICDRIKELVKVNGKQVAPAEIESVLLEHNDVADACVFGVDDATTGEKPVAVVVLKEVQGKEKEEKEKAQKILKFINEKLARYKHVKEIEIVKEIAKTSTGKLLRRKMKKDFLDSSRKSKL